MLSRISAMRVRNLRSFSDCSSYVALKKINVLVGKNSSGKSTFLRLFPLLRQSIEEKTKGPILWYGNYVDFGNFKNAINIKSKSQEIFFDFEVVLDNQNEIPGLWNSIRNFIHQQKFSSEATISIGVSNYNNTTSASTIYIKLESSEVTIELSNKEVSKITAKNRKLDIEKNISDDYRVFPGSLIPEIVPSGIFKEGKIKTHTKTTDTTSLESFLLSYHHGGTQASSITPSIDNMQLMNKKSCLEYFRSEFKDKKQFLKNLKGDEDRFAETVHLYNIVLHIPNIIEMTNTLLDGYFKGVRYLGPVRATAERFYRYQDLQIDEIDHLGSNLPMVLSSLSPAQKENLGEWIVENLGFSIDVSEEGSHYAILIKEEGSEEYFNISDMGFGYSQLLPIIVSVWLEKESIEKVNKYHDLLDSSTSVIVIEQPELHLHPLLQYKFAQAIARLTAMINEANIQFIFETHSQHIIEALGDSITDKKLSQEDISITIFEKDSAGETKTKTSGFDESGYLINWPAGFLSA